MLLISRRVLTALLSSVFVLRLSRGGDGPFAKEDTSGGPSRVPVYRGHPRPPFLVPARPKAGEDACGNVERSALSVARCQKLVSFVMRNGAMAENDDVGKQARQLTEVWTLAIMFPACIGAGFLVGYGLDKLFHTYPWCAAIFTGFGVIAAFVNLFRVAGGSDDGDGSAAGRDSSG